MFEMALVGQMAWMAHGFVDKADVHRKKLYETMARVRQEIIPESVENLGDRAEAARDDLQISPGFAGENKKRHCSTVFQTSSSSTA